MAAPIRLYHYWRSSSSWRVRWALSHKKLAYEPIAVDLLSGESESPEHLARHPLGYVPVMEVDGKRLIESVSMLEYLEETHPSPALLPRDPWKRAQVRSLVEVINADTQPLQNLSPQFLHSDDPEKRKAWAQHWIRNGLGAYEKIASATAGKFSVGDELTLADLVLIPQIYNADRYEIGLDSYPTLKRIHQNAIGTESYHASHPDRFKP